MLRRVGCMDFEEYAKMYELEGSHWWFRGKRKIARNMITRYASLAPEDWILDVGCGTGGMMELLSEYGRPLGLDICSIGLEFACERGLGSLTQGTALTLPFADETFGLITAFDVLYHERVEDDLEALREFCRICRPGGILLLTDSALPILRSQHDEAYHASRRYTASELRRKVTQAGFEVEKLTYVNTLLLPFVFLVRLWKRYVHNGNVPTSDLWAMPAWLNAVLYAIYSLEATLITRVNLPIGSSLVCVARKLG